MITTVKLSHLRNLIEHKHGGNQSPLVKGHQNIEFVTCVKSIKHQDYVKLVTSREIEFVDRIHASFYHLNILLDKMTILDGDKFEVEIWPMKRNSNHLEKKLRNSI